MSSQAFVPEEEGQYTGAMRTIHSLREADRKEIANLRDLLAKTREELAGVREELLNLRRGIGVQVVIDGKKFVLADSIHLVKDALEQPREPMHGANGLADSFVL